MLGAGGIRRDVGQVDLGLLARGQLDLGLFCGIFQALQGQYILAQVNALFLFELSDQVIDDALVEILATQEGVAVGGEHFKLLFAIHIGDLDDRDIEGAPPQVIDRNLAILATALVQAEGQRGGRGFIDDALDIQAGNAPGVLGGLALGIVEVAMPGVRIDLTVDTYHGKKNLTFLVFYHQKNVLLLLFWVVILSLKELKIYNL